MRGGFAAGLFAWIALLTVTAAKSAEPPGRVPTVGILNYAPLRHPAECLAIWGDYTKVS
jgi:hypothetical protein